MASGSHFLNFDAEEPNSERPDVPPTLVVLGTGKSGTTLAIGALHRLGLELGARVNNFGEDVDINERIVACGKPSRFWRIFTLRRRIRDIVERRRSEYGAWGFKSPFLPPVLWLVASTIPNPRYVVISRNNLASALSFERSGRFGWSWRRWYFVTTLSNLLIALFAISTRKPVLVASFEDVTVQSETFIDDLVVFSGLRPTGQMRRDAEAFISSERGYQTIGRVRAYVTRAREDAVIGWAADQSNLTEPLPLQARLDGEIIGETLADQYRHAVAVNGYHPTGRCGFTFAFDPPLAPDALKRLELFAPTLEAPVMLHPKNFETRPR